MRRPCPPPPSPLFGVGRHFARRLSRGADWVSGAGSGANQRGTRTGGARHGECEQPIWSPRAPAPAPGLAGPSDQSGGRSQGRARPAGAGGAAGTGRGGAGRGAHRDGRARAGAGGPYRELRARGREGAAAGRIAAGSALLVRGRWDGSRWGPAFHRPGGGAERESRLTDVPRAARAAPFPPPRLPGPGSVPSSPGFRAAPARPRLPRAHLGAERPPRAGETALGAGAARVLPLGLAEHKNPPTRMFDREIRNKVWVPGVLSCPKAGDEAVSWLCCGLVKPCPWLCGGVCPPPASARTAVGRQVCGVCPGKLCQFSHVVSGCNTFENAAFSPVQSWHSLPHEFLL